MAYTDQYTLATDPTFLTRVRMALLDYCMDIESEAATTANHVARLQKARDIAAGSAAWAPEFALLICAHDAALTSGSADSAVKNDVASVFNLVVGV